MKVKLFDFQEDALVHLRAKVAMARQHASVQNPQAISFSSPTGSGKTIIATALMEEILNGASGFERQQDAVILWISDMPELNEQTRLKVESKSDKIRARQLVTVDAGFDQERFTPGHIYFLNTQKLGDNKLLTDSGVNKREYSIWQTLTNTARHAPDRLYIIIDEAHRGMREGRGEKEARTILQRFIKGSEEHGLAQMPMVLGVSATPRRFDELLAGTSHTVHKVHVPTDEVRKSGLIKDRILIHYPDEAGAEMSLLAESVSKWQAMKTSWTKFCQAEGVEAVRPILVIQVEDGKKGTLTKTDLSGLVQTLEGTLGRRLADGEVVHAFNEAGDQSIQGRTIRQVDASRIDEDPRIGIVLFKMSLSTGWDCPRAEVMMSFRRAEDHTYIAQLLGRMVRTPLARRIERDASLNDVHLFLPHFDQPAVAAVVEDLRNVEDVPPAETGTSRELVTLGRRPATEEIFAAMQDLVTYRVEAVRKQPALRRLLALGRQMTFDGIHPEAITETQEFALKHIADEIATIRSASDYAVQVEGVRGTSVRTVAVVGASLTSEGDGQRIETHSADIDFQFEQAGRKLGNGLHIKHWERNESKSAIDVKVDIVLLSQTPEAMQALETVADEEFDRRYEPHRVEIGRLNEEHRTIYERLRLAAAKPRDVPWRLPDTIGFRTSPKDDLYAQHLYVNDQGKFRANLGTWEAAVLAEELERPETVGWLRNVDRQPWSLEIPYQDGAATRPTFPDLLIARKEGKKFRFDILEPHDPSLKDNYPKAVGLANFAERHGHLYGRIQMIRKKKLATGEAGYVRLDLNRTQVRRKVMNAGGEARLNEIFDEEAA